MRGGIRPFEVEEEREGGRRRRRGAEHQRLVGKARAGRERERGDEPAVADEARLDGPIFSWGPLVGNKAGSIFPLLLASFSVFFTALLIWFLVLPGLCGNLNVACEMPFKNLVNIKKGLVKVMAWYE